MMVTEKTYGPDKIVFLSFPNDICCYQLDKETWDEFVELAKKKKQSLLIAAIEAEFIVTKERAVYMANCIQIKSMFL